MQNPASVLSLIVAKLQAIDGVVRLVGDDQSRIYAYADSPPMSSSLSRAIYQMESPSVMVAWMGTGPLTQEGLGLFGHDISIFIRAEDNLGGEDQPTFANIVSAILNGTATGDQNKFINTQLSVYLQLATIPSITRIHDDEGTVDLFEIKTWIEETTDVET